jgi:hypothetical protein
MLRIIIIMEKRPSEVATFSIPSLTDHHRTIIQIQTIVVVVVYIEEEPATMS